MIFKGAHFLSSDWIKQWFLIALLTFCVNPTLRSQEVFYNNYTIKDGLPSNNIYNLIEDRNGFIWIATERGVSRYDGVRFTNFSSENGLPDNDVLHIEEDSAGRIWFMSFASEPGYYYKGVIYNATNDSFLAKIKRKRDISHPTIYLIDLDTRSIYFRMTEKYNNSFYACIDNKRRITTGLYSTYGLTPEYISFKNNHNLIFNSGGIFGQRNNGKNILKIPRSHLGGIDLKNKQVGYVNVVNGQFGWLNYEAKKYYSLPEKNIIFSDFDPINNELYLLKKQVIKILKDSQTLYQYHIPDYIFNFIKVTRNKNIWLTSTNQGLFLIRNNRTLKLCENVANNSVLSLCANKNDLMIGTSGNGIYKNNFTTNNYSRIDLGKENLNRVVRICYWNNLFYCGSDYGLMEYSPASSALKLLKVVAIKDIEITDNNELLAASFDGLSIINRKNPENIKKIPVDGRSYAISRVNDTQIWFGKVQGLYLYKSVNNIHNNVTAFITGTAIDYSHIKDIKTDKLKNVWIATDKNGLFFYIPKAGFFPVQAFIGNTIQKTVSAICNNLFIDSLNRIWLAADGGISVIAYTIKNNHPQFSIINYTVANGLPDIAINDVIIYNNKIIVASQSGCYEFSPIESVKFNAVTQITSVMINGNIPVKDPLKLAFDENNLVFNFSASFIDAITQQYNFKYRIAGLNSQWIYIHNTQVSLFGLSPGQYELQVAAIGNNNSDGPVTTFRFTIHAAWYRSDWFIAIVVATIVVALFIFLRNEKRRLETVKNLAVMELKVLRAQMDPHFIFNSLNSIQQNIFKKDFIKTSNYISKFASILRSNLHYSSLDTITLKEEIKFITNYLELEKYRFHDLFDYQIHTHEIEDPEIIKLPALMVQPLIENAIKHGFKFTRSGGMVEIYFTLIENKYIKIKVCDNGVGLPENFTVKTSQKPFDSVGLSIILQRVNLIKSQSKAKLCSFSISNKTDTNGVISELVLPVNLLE